MKKILTVCSRGNSRSVCLGWLLKDGMGFDAIAMGIDSSKDDTKEMLYKWAEQIIVVDTELLSLIPPTYKDKVLLWDVGPDRFFRGFEPELIGIYKKYMKESGWEIQRGDM